MVPYSKDTHGSASARERSSMELNHSDLICISNVRNKFHSDSFPSTPGNYHFFLTNCHIGASLYTLILTYSSQRSFVICSLYPPNPHFLLITLAQIVDSFNQREGRNINPCCVWSCIYIE